METQQIFNSNKPKLNIGFFFLCLGVLITLITSVVSFLNLIFETLDKQFPDVLNSTYQYGYSTYDFENIRIALATLIIFFPIFITISYFWKKFTNSEMGHIDEIIKKWVIYIILFLSSIVTAIDLVILVKYFVSGEITNRFILKVISILIVVIIVGVYYVLLLKSKKDSKIKIGLIFGISGIILVLGSIFYSFSIMGSPAKQRLLRLDDRRLSDLQSLQYQIINYWQQKEKLPATLSELSNPMTGYSLPVPPGFNTGEKYEYIIKDANKLSFKICATFALPIPKGWRESQGYYGGEIMPMSSIGKDVAVSSAIYPDGGLNQSWNHDAGYTCFDRIIDKDIYPPFEKPKTASKAI
jgi:hypothetical protein